MRVDFPDGHWAEIHTVAEMPRRVTVNLQDMLAETPAEQSGFASLRDMGRLRDTLIAMVIKSWDYDAEAGDDAASIYDLPEASYDALKDATDEHWEKAGFFNPEKEKEEKPKPSPRRKTTAGKNSSA